MPEPGPASPSTSSGITGDGSTGAGTATGATVGTDTLSNVNFILGSTYGDSITGSSALIFEQIEGGKGNDTLDGGAITDTLNGDNSNRVSYLSTTVAGVTVDLAAGTAVGAGGSDAGSDTLVNFNQVRGSNFADTLLGSNRTDLTESFEGRIGNDSIDGRGGFDIARYDNANTAGVIASLVTGIVSNDGDGGADTLSQHRRPLRLPVQRQPDRWQCRQRGHRLGRSGGDFPRRRGQRHHRRRPGL